MNQSKRAMQSLQADAFRGHGLSLLGRCASCGVSRLMLFPQESLPCTLNIWIISIDMEQNSADSLGISEVLKSIRAVSPN